MENKGQSHVWSDKNNVLVKMDDDDFCVMTRDGIYYLIEEEEEAHDIILKMLSNRNPVYHSFKDFIEKRNPIQETEYHEYEKRYLDSWYQRSNQITVCIQKGKDILKCVSLIKRFDTSMSMQAMKEKILYGGLIMEHRMDCAHGERNRCFCDLIHELQTAGASVEMYRLGKEIGLDEVRALMGESV